MYPVITVPDEAGDILEQLGTKPKFWFSDANANRYLFQLNKARVKTRQAKTGVKKLSERGRHQRYQVPDGT